jgi:hypothetical protein
VLPLNLVVFTSPGVPSLRDVRLPDDRYRTFPSQPLASIGESAGVIPPEDGTETGVISIPIDDAVTWMPALALSPAALVLLRRTATRVTLGAISSSNSGHFPLKPYSNCIKPVT